MKSKEKNKTDISIALHAAMERAKDQPSPKLKKVEHLIPRMIEGLNSLDNAN